MALEIITPELGNQFVDKAGITPNGEFTYPVDDEITAGDLVNLIDQHRHRFRSKYERDRLYYKGDHKVLHQAPKPSYKPDNRVVYNFPRKAVTTFNGYFIGNPISIDARKDKAADTFVSDWTKEVDFDAVASDVSKMASIYGHAYLLVYQSVAELNQTPEPRVAAVDPLNAFIIYDDTLEKRVKYGVTYRKNYKGQLEITLYDDKMKRDLLMTSSAQYLDQVRVTANPYGMVPLIEVDENSERMALCEDIVTLIDQLDKAMSNKANDNDYFADAILKIIGPKIDKDTYKDMRNNRMLNIQGSEASKAQAEFMGKPDNDTSQEHLVDRLVNSIYEIANVTNLNDDAFNGNPSGVSLKLKYQSMDNMARQKTLRFKRALRDMFKAVFAVSYMKVSADAWKELEFTFTRTIPVNFLEEAQALSYASGKISNRTLFGQLSFVDDPDEELKQMKKEQQDAMTAANNTVQTAMLGAQTDQQKKVGGSDDNSEAGAEADKPTSQPGQQNK